MLLCVASSVASYKNAAVVVFCFFFFFKKILSLDTFC